MILSGSEIKVYENIAYAMVSMSSNHVYQRTDTFSLTLFSAYKALLILEYYAGTQVRRRHITELLLTIPAWNKKDRLKNKMNFVSFSSACIFELRR
jgi:hypothetical protein